MSMLSIAAIREIDYIVIINADDATDTINKLSVPALALKGKEDYVPVPNLATTILEGGHVSPLEVPKEVFKFIIKVSALN
jgi:hypothetical protein